MPGVAGSKFRSRVAYAVALALALAALYVLGIAIRRHVVEQQLPERGRPLPFTMESAVQFRSIRTIYTEGTLPLVDPEIQVPDGIRTYEHDTVGMEYVVAWLARLFPAEITLTDRVRWISVAWFCLGIPLMAVWIRRVSGSWGGGLVAGYVYAVSIASIIRSTGHEISHENFALPLLIAHLALAAGGPARDRSGWIRLALSSILLAAALATWDLIQYTVLLWSVTAVIRWLRRPWTPTSDAAQGLWVRVAGVILAGVLSPYLRVHDSLLSPAIVPLWALGVGTAALGIPSIRALPAARLRAGLVVILAMGLAAGLVAATDAYGHFGSLAIAKIRFLNRKPPDPSLLTFDQRILWTPALHSADWRWFRLLFPYAVPLTAILPVVVWFRRDKQGASQSASEFLHVHLWISVALFFLFVRFCVFAALFAAAVLGIEAARAARRRGVARWGALMAIAMGGLVESGAVINGAKSWSSVPVLYSQLEEMGEWLRVHVSPEPVLANFQTSGFVLAYGRCPVVLHPKFESPEIRRRVEDHATHLFRGTERGLRDWAEGYGAKYMAYSLGEFSNLAPDLTLRYMVDALTPPPDAPARRFEYRPEETELFHLVWQNPKYRVFRIVTSAEETDARRLLAEARMAFEAGKMDDAEALAAQAYIVNPCYREALQMVGRAATLRALGFQGEVAEP